MGLERANGGFGHGFIGVALAGKTFGTAVNGVNVVVAIMEKVAHLFPWARLQAGVFAAQSLVQ